MGGGVGTLVVRAGVRNQQESKDQWSNNKQKSPAGTEAEHTGDRLSLCKAYLSLKLGFHQWPATSVDMGGLQRHIGCAEEQLH